MTPTRIDRSTIVFDPAAPFPKWLEQLIEAHNRSVDAILDLSRQAERVRPLALALASTPIAGAVPPAWLVPVLEADFLDVGSPEAVAGYHRNALGYVQGKGFITTAAGQVAGTTMFELPASYRPKETVRFAVRGTGATFQALTIESSGLVSPSVNIAAGGNIALDFHFLAEL